MLETLGQTPGQLTFKARHQKSPQESPPVLLKIGDTGQRNLTEAVLDKLSNLEHPSLAKLLDHGVDPKRGRYLVQRWVDGENLEDARRGFEEGRVPLRKALRWSLQLLDGLATLHLEGLLHGDIKPSNIVIAQDGTAVLIDYGCVTEISDRTPASKADLKVGPGTPEYLCPDNRLTSPGRDLYALGLTLYALLTAHLPSSATEAVPSRRDPLLPSALDQILARALGLQDPKISTAQHFKAALEALLGAPMAAPTVDSLSPPTRRVEIAQIAPAPPFWPWLVAALLFMVGAGLGQHFSPPAAKLELPPALWTAVGVKPALHKRQVLWQTCVLGRPVVPFLGLDLAAGSPPARARAEWCAAVLEDAHFQQRPLRFDYRNEQPDSCEVWLVGDGFEERFLFRVTPDESELFDRPAPLLARTWSALLEDTVSLVRPSARAGERSAGRHLLQPWSQRYQTLRSGLGSLSEPETVELWMEAFDSLSEEIRSRIDERPYQIPKVES